jgi:hypothetical protein
MEEKTKISVEMTGATFTAEIDHDASIDEMMDLFYTLLRCHAFSEKIIRDAFYKQSFADAVEVD